MQCLSLPVPPDRRHGRDQNQALKDRYVVESTISVGHTIRTIGVTRQTKGQDKARGTGQSILQDDIGKGAFAFAGEKVSKGCFERAFKCGSTNAVHGIYQNE